MKLLCVYYIILLRDSDCHCSIVPNIVEFLLNHWKASIDDDCETKMKKKSTTLITTILIIAISVFTCFTLSSAEDPGAGPFAQVSGLRWTDDAKNPKNPDSIYPYVSHADLSPAGVAYSGYDESRLNIILDELKPYEKKAADDKVILNTETALPLLLDSLFEETDRLNTQLSLLDIKYYRDANNEEISDLSAKYADQNVAISDECFQVLRDILKGPNGALLKEKLTDEEEEFLATYEDMTAREKKLYNKETMLVQKYDKLLLNCSDPKEDNREFTQILSDLVKVRNQIAHIYGYDNYPDYAYNEIYCRDYSSDDAAALYADVKKYIVPLYVASCDKFYHSDVQAIFDYDDSGDTILERIAPYIGQIHPELKTSFNYLRRFHMYDIDDSPQKLDVGFTTDLPEYGSPYIFNKPYCEAADYSVTIHEFGHFNAGFHHKDHSLLMSEGSYDIAEIQSQGLELLFLEYYDELFGDSADVIESETISNILAGIVTGCMYDEFQQELFANPDMSGKEMNALAAKLADEYGLIDAGYTSKDLAHYDWVQVSHTYESPMYYISYATSALSALDIWAESLDDRNSAVDKYMKISAVDLDKAYLEGLKECGLRNIFEDGVVKDIAETIKPAVQ